MGRTALTLNPCAALRSGAAASEVHHDALHHRATPRRPVRAGGARYPSIWSAPTRCRIQTFLVLMTWG